MESIRQWFSLGEGSYGWYYIGSVWFIAQHLNITIKATYPVLYLGPLNVCDSYRYTAWPAAQGMWHLGKILKQI